MKIPNLFLVGAPKCGTTSLYRYLRQHPEIYMSGIKEPHFFGSDLGSDKYIRNEKEYLSLFSSRQDERIVGEASVYYLYSEQAAREIHAFNQASRIIIMLRNPVDMICSLHSQAVSSGNEDIIDFSDALDAEGDRRLQRRIPDIADFPQGLLYSDIASYPQQVIRYLERFGDRQVHVILFEDFVDSPARIFRETLEFLSLEDCEFQVNFDTENPNRRLRSVGLEHYLKRRTGIRSTMKRISPSVYSSMYSVFHRLNAVISRRQEMDPHLRASLCDVFEPDVLELSEIIGRDLTSWMNKPT
ncbi:MAG: sulfotransferase [Halioglobus sp.]